MNGKILKVLGSSRQEHNWSSYLQWVQNRFFKEQFERGKLHGQCPERFDNENVGHAMPCPVYQVGYLKPLPVPLALKPGDSSEFCIQLFARLFRSYLARVF